MTNSAQTFWPIYTETAETVIFDVEILEIHEIESEKLYILLELVFFEKNTCTIYSQKRDKMEENREILNVVYKEEIESVSIYDNAIVIRLIENLDFISEISKIESTNCVKLYVTEKDDC